MVSVAVAVYAVSAGLASINAWVSVVTSVSPSDPGLVGVLVSNLAWILALGALGIALLGFHDLNQSRVAAPPEGASTLETSRVLFRSGLAVAVLAGFFASLLVLPIIPPDAAYAWENGLEVAWLSSSAVAAVLLLVAVSLPAIRWNVSLPRIGAWLGFTIGLLGLAGEVTTKSADIARNWTPHVGYVPPTVLTYGGWPLVNDNVVFGAIVAVSAAWLSWSWWTLPHSPPASP